MGVLCDYFRASDRTTALALHEHPDGLFEAAVSAGTEAVDLKSLDPVVILGTLVGLLSGAPREDGNVSIDGIPSPALVDDEGGERVLLELSVVVRDTLADATEAALAEAAPLWAKTEELAHTYDGDGADELRTVADELAGLARRAKAADQLIYCAICV